MSEKRVLSAIRDGCKCDVSVMREDCIEGQHKKWDWRGAFVRLELLDNFAD